jgi:erythrin-vacuolar iron transport family protein
MDELQALEKAMKLEQSGLDFYRQAAERSQDPETAETFRTLADDEMHHYGYIERQYNSLRAGDSWKPVPELDLVKEIESEAPVFPKGIMALEKLPENANDEDALLFGLGIEASSFELYTKNAGQADNLEAKKMFGRLAAAERGHFDLLMLRYESRYSYPR